MKVMLAWCVHLFTASGVLFAFLAVQAIYRQSWTEALLWLLVALVVDGVDGWLARSMQVRERLPRIAGDSLDLVIDYLTYVFVPVLFMVEARLLGDGANWLLAAAILISSLYVFARTDMKTDDGYFRGFPALWNVVAVYLYALQLPSWAAAGLVILLVVMTFAPIHVVHPFRTRHFPIIALLAAAMWLGFTAALIIPDLSATQAVLLRAASLAAMAVLLGLGLWRTVRGGQRDPRVRWRARQDSNL